ncbi:MAG: hypothetical protein IT256_03065, partial [Chitinophagaceae bacterium]|nr:hypothetical protein [Chitinophagaceae bacterium]
MKKNALLVFACLLLAAATQLTSCKKEDKTATTKKDIVGTWTSESAYGKQVTDGVTDFELTVPLVDQMEFTFRADGTVTAINRTETPVETVNSTYTISGNMIISTTTTGGVTETDTTEYEITAADKLIIK